MKILLYYYSTISWMQMSYSTKYWHYTVGCQCFCTGYNCCYLLYFLCVYLPASFSHLSVFLLCHIYQDGVLSLRAVSIHSAGQYTCHASNSEGNVTCVTKVKIKGQLLPNSLSVFLPANSFSFCDVCVPNWLEATIIYISVSCPCIMQQSGKRSSNWTWLVFSHAVTK